LEKNEKINDQSIIKIMQNSKKQDGDLLRNIRNPTSIDSKSELIHAARSINSEKNIQSLNEKNISRNDDINK